MRWIVRALIFLCIAGAARAGCDANLAQGPEAMLRDLAETADCITEPGLCRWTYVLGDAASRQTYEKALGRLRTCTDLTEATRDQGVNHPDFYDAWAFRWSGGALTLSIKDKSALDATFVVLRVLPED